MRQFRARGLWIQLNPREVLQAVGIHSKSPSQLQQAASNLEGSSNLQLQQFMQLDPSISRESLLKVSSCVFLGVFGWRWLDCVSSVLRC